MLPEFCEEAYPYAFLELMNTGWPLVTLELPPFGIATVSKIQCLNVMSKRWLMTLFYVQSDVTEK